MTFRRPQRLTRPADYRRVMMQGRAVRRHEFEVCVAPAAGGPVKSPTRLGITIRRAAACNSVGRNRLKRWVREVFRRHPEAVAAGRDIVVSVTHPPTVQGYRDVEALLVPLLTEACGV